MTTMVILAAIQSRWFSVHSYSSAGFGELPYVEVTPAFKNKFGGGYQPLVVDYNQSAHDPSRLFFIEHRNVKGFGSVSQRHGHCSTIG